MTANPTESARPAPLTDSVLAAIAEALRGVRYGTVTVVVQDGRVVQIDRTERRRLKTDTDI
ncbi:MAG: YezD family protein [Planctomycetaceae bacterium]|nr:YezD family protein [Planctomycetaceae bacterium]